MRLNEIRAKIIEDASAKAGQPLSAEGLSFRLAPEGVKCPDGRGADICTPWLLTLGLGDYLNFRLEDGEITEALRQAAADFMAGRPEHPEQPELDPKSRDFHVKYIFYRAGQAELPEEDPLIPQDGPARRFLVKLSLAGMGEDEKLSRDEVMAFYRNEGRYRETAALATLAAARLIDKNRLRW